MKLKTLIKSLALTTALLSPSFVAACSLPGKEEGGVLATERSIASHPVWTCSPRELLMTQRLIAAERRLPSPIAAHYWQNNVVGTGNRQSYDIDTLMARLNTGLTVIRAIPGANTPVCGRSDLPATIAAARGMQDRLKELGLLGEADGFNLVITSTDKADDLAIGLKHIIGSLTSEEDQAFAADHVIPIADPTAAWAYDLGILNVVKGPDGSIDPDKSMQPHGLISGRGAVVAKNGTVIFSVMEDKTSDFAKTTPESLASQIAALLEPIAGSKRPRKAA